MKLRVGALLFLSLLLLSCSYRPEKPQLLLVSFDGFRADYLSKTETPNFDKIILGGVTSDGLIPVFPTKTFPNHYAIATGLYPENNGLIGNNMYDPKMDKRYSIGNRDAVENADWYFGEPIWNTVEKSGKKAGAMFWIGSEAPIQGMQPTHWKTYDGRIKNEARIDTVLKWMTREVDPIDFGTVYFSFVDSDGHRYGPDSEEVVKAIEKADSLMGYMLNELTKLDPESDINLLIVSDHGMSEVSTERKVILDDYIDPDDIDIISYSPSMMFNAVKDNEEELYEALKSNEKHYKIYRKADIPERFHLKNSYRTPEFLMLAEDGYTINTLEYFGRRGEDYPSGGAHGYDNQHEKMHGFFIAYGPAFKEGMQIPAFDMVHLYELMTRVLYIKPAENDGNLKAIKKILR